MHAIDKLPIGNNSLIFYGTVYGMSRGTRGSVIVPTIETECLTLTVEECARILGISRGSAYTAVREGAIPHIRVLNRILVPRQAIDQLLQGSGQGHGPTSADE